MTSQLVMEPTHYNHVLDLPLTSHPSIVSDITIIPGMSDHEAIIGKKRPITAKRKVYLYYKANLDEGKTKSQSVHNIFFSSDPYKQSVEENWILHKQCILDTIDNLLRIRAWASVAFIVH